MIVVFLNSSDTLWIPVYSLNDKIFQSQGYIIFATFQIIFYIFTGYIVVKSCSIFMSVKMFHENKTTLMVWFLMQWFEGILAKLIIFPYQIGIMSFTIDPDKIYYGWWTQDTSEMALVPERSQILPLFFASWVFWHYVYSMIFALVALAIERFFATYFVEDYEHVPRRYISYTLILFSNLITIPYSYLMVNNLIPFWIAFAQCVLNGQFIFFGYLAFWRINVYMKNKLARRSLKGNSKYSLSRKFQIEENIRSFKLAIKMVIAAVVYLSLALILVICLIFEIFKGYESIFAQFLDNIILGSASILSLTLLWCCPSWKESFLKQLPIIGSYRSPRVGHFNILPESSTSESDVYFKQLKQAWI